MKGWKAHSLIPFTARGAAFFFLSIAIVAIGFFRMDLASLLWGSAFFLISLYVLAGNVVERAVTERYIREKPDSFDIFFTGKGFFPGEMANVKVKVLIPRFFVPGFTLRFSGRLVFSETREISIESELKGGVNDFFIDLKAEKRGLYRTVETVIRCRDFMGFTTSKIYLDVDEYFRVFPSITEKREGLPRFEGGEDTREYLNRRKRSDELLEVRKYFPGDDLRKLNWKIYAHIGELFLRIGEEKLQRKARILFILDNSLSPKKISARRGKRFVRHSEMLEDYLDCLVDTFGSVALSLIGEGLTISILKDSGERIEISRDSIEELLNFLSEVEWRKSSQAMRVILKERMHAVVFSTPLSYDLERIIRELRLRKCSMSIFVKETFTAAEREGSSIKEHLLRLVFKREGSIREYLEPVITEMNADSVVESLKNAPWRIRDVRKV